MYRIKTRPPLENEIPVIRAVSRPDPASWGCLVLIFGVIWPWLLASMGRGLGGLGGEDTAVLGRNIGLAIGLVVFATSAVSYYRFERRKRVRGSHDVVQHVVEEIYVEDARVIQIALISDDEPILCFELGNQKLLYLQGQWLRDPEMYGEEPLEGDPNEETVNGLWGRSAFPNSQFVVTRLPNSGRVLSIRTSGVYREPEAELDVLKPDYEFGDSEIFDGELSEIGEVLEQAHQRAANRGGASSATGT